MVQQSKTLSPFDATALIVGVVIGAGIFKTPSLVAAHAGSAEGAVLLWVLGGLISLAGALCYAELATAFPDSGGDYYFLRRAFGANPAFLYAWARITILQTGSIAMLAFVIGDYGSEVFRLGSFSSAVYAALVIVALTAVNTSGVRSAARLQNALSTGIVLGLLAVVAAGLSLPASPVVAPAGTPFSEPGKALIFVLLTYGGWNEAAYISAEMKQVERNMARVLFSSIAIITAVYVSANFAFLRVLGMPGAAASETAAAELMRLAVGEKGAQFISLLIVLAALGTMHAAIITGSRSGYALGRDFPSFRFLGSWTGGAGVPDRALLVQAGIALALVGLGAVARNGFATMVEYTAPVFWFFFLLVGLSLMVLRRKEPEQKRPFRTPLYPVTPLLFCAICIYMLYSSFAFAGIGTFAGAGVLAAGAPFLLRSGQAKHGGREDP